MDNLTGLDPDTSNSALSHNLAKKGTRQREGEIWDMGYTSWCEGGTRTRIRIRTEFSHQTAQNKIPQVSNPHGLTLSCPRTHATPPLRSTTRPRKTTRGEVRQATSIAEEVCTPPMTIQSSEGKKKTVHKSSQSLEAMQIMQWQTGTGGKIS